MQTSRMSVGYVVRLLHDDLTVKDILYTKDMHVFYSSFEDAASAAHTLAVSASQTINGSMISLIHAETQGLCDSKGYAEVFRILPLNPGESIQSVLLFAMYNP